MLWLGRMEGVDDLHVIFFLSLPLLLSQTPRCQKQRYIYYSRNISILLEKP